MKKKMTRGTQTLQRPRRKMGSSVEKRPRYERDESDHEIC